MISPLLTEAAKAEDVASVFSLFKHAVPEPVETTHVTRLISELYVIGTTLREISTTVYLPQYRSRYAQVSGDLNLVLKSLHATLERIERLFGAIGDPNANKTELVYRRTWHDIQLSFIQPGRTLLTRLDLYRTFLQTLNGIIVGIHAGQETIIYRLRGDVLGLDQIPALNDAFRNLNLQADARNIHPSRSYERQRPQADSASSASPVDSIPPLSPSSATSSRDYSAVMNGYDHWTKRVFEGASSTALPKSRNARTECFERGKTETPEKLYRDYEFLFDLKFRSEHDINVGFYVRKSDQRAKLLFETHRKRSSTYSCRSLDGLEFRRSDNVLHLLTQENGRLEKWATIKFKTMERLVLVHCILVALRAYDTYKPVQTRADFELDGEKVVFAAKIDDDDYLHTLRIYYDREIKAVRLMASVSGGELKNTPVWTAFIHFFLSSSVWLIQPSSDHPNRILLCTLTRHIFSSEYEPEADRTGRHILNFTRSSDAIDFVRTIQDLSRACSSR